MNTKEINSEMIAERALIASIIEQIDNSDSFDSKESAERDLKAAEFKLKQLEKAHAEAEKKEAEAARLKAIAQYKADLYGYAKDATVIPDLDAGLVRSLEAFDQGFKQHHKLTMELWSKYEKLVKEAQRLNQEEPQRPHYTNGNGNIGPYLHRWLLSNKMICYIAKLLQVNFDPIIKGGWIETSK